jgi:CRP-like cAMP-binding protein
MSEPLTDLAQFVRKHPAGTVLFREGDRGQIMYVIRTGKVGIWRRISETDVTLATLGPGEFFGEMALLEGLRRSAGATVVEEAQLIEPRQDAFEILVRKNGEIAVPLMRRLSARLRQADKQIQALMGCSGSARLSGREAERVKQTFRQCGLLLHQGGRQLLADSKRGSRQQVDGYGKYLSLKERFEYAEGTR